LLASSRCLNRFSHFILLLLQLFRILNHRFDILFHQEPATLVLVHQPLEKLFNLVLLLIGKLATLRRGECAAMRLRLSGRGRTRSLLRLRREVSGYLLLQRDIGTGRLDESGSKR
jgi:hypothetical protein